MKGVNIENREILYLVRPDHFCPAGCRLRRVCVFPSWIRMQQIIIPGKLPCFRFPSIPMKKPVILLKKIVPAELAAKKWFTSVIDTASLNSQIQSNNELRQLVTDYISKLNTLNYSDPELSGKISQLIDADAFLFVTVEEWRYTVEKEKNYANASIGVKLIDPATGKIMWRAAHNKRERYMLVKSDMSRIARSVIIDLINKMPH